jgi:hypothetical protein
MLARESRIRTKPGQTPYSFVVLASRFAVADIFWRSGQTNSGAAGSGRVPQHHGRAVLPVLLVIGFATRLSLSEMTLVIQRFLVPGGWNSTSCGRSVGLHAGSRAPQCLSLKRQKAIGSPISTEIWRPSYLQSVALRRCSRAIRFKVYR